VVLHEHVDELLREILTDVRVTVCDMGNKINKIPQRDQTGIGSGCGRRHENLAVRFILVVLGAEIFNIRPEQRK
jgi:hypothetical protein